MTSSVRSKEHLIWKNISVTDDGSCKRLDWMCDNKIDCIPAWHVCDRAPDCPDKSDELECPDLNAKIENAPEESDSMQHKICSYRYSSHMTILKSLV